MYDIRLGLIGKRVMDFILVIMKLFFAKCYGRGATSETGSKNGDFAPTGAGWPKISCRRGRSPPTVLFCQITRINDLSYGIKIWTDFSFVLLQSTRFTYYRQTDRQTE